LQKNKRTVALKAFKTPKHTWILRCLIWERALARLVGIAAGHAAGLGSNPLGRRFISSGFIPEQNLIIGENGVQRFSKPGGGFLLLMKTIRCLRCLISKLSESLKSYSLFDKWLHKVHP
jgi:hypothetical protein